MTEVGHVLDPDNLTEADLPALRDLLKAVATGLMLSAKGTMPPDLSVLLAPDRGHDVMDGRR